MKIYQFIKYYDGLSLDKLFASNTSHAILCFDLEDSVQDVFCPQNNSKLKSLYRNLLYRILQSNTHGNSIGVRINACGSDEQQKDIELLTSLGPLNTIFLPKAESRSQVVSLLQSLDKYGIQFNELVPVIESQKGIQNIKQIEGLASNKIKRIAFGHCDYNLNAGHFPFYHHSSREYWSWIEYMVAVIAPYKLGFVNSPFLELDNHSGFLEMLSSLKTICQNNLGQITLTSSQSIHCFNHKQSSIPFFRRISNRLSMRNDPTLAKDFIMRFEKENTGKAFTLTEKNRTLLSPHEYQSAKLHLSNSERAEYNFTFMGGCFPVQGGILFEELFHQQLKGEANLHYDLNFNINIIRYERFKGCLDKLKAHAEHHPIDLMIFCVRPEPVLRLTKLYYKYIDAGGRKRRMLHLPIFGIRLPVKNRAEHPPNNFHGTSGAASNKFWINLNYLLGFLIGNNHVALKNYLFLVADLKQYCSTHDIPMMIMGPAIRTNTLMEKFLSYKLESYLEKRMDIPEDKFIRGSDLVSDGQGLFNENGIHANEHYHRLIAVRIFKTISTLSTSEEEIERAKLYQNKIEFSNA